MITACFTGIVTLAVNVIFPQISESLKFTLVLTFEFQRRILYCSLLDRF